MTILCIDTSQATAIALVRDGKVLARTRNESGRHHAESITPLVREALADAGLPTTLTEAGLTAIAVGTGPAPFTGLRAGLVSARVFAAAASIPVYGVSSLDVIARQALDLLSQETEVIALSDARRKELYWARYRTEGPDDVTRLEGPEVESAADLARSVKSNAVRLVSCAPLPPHAEADLAGLEQGPIAPLDAAVLARIVTARLSRGLEDSLDTEPLYLRRPDIHGQPAARL
ncbi:tRNA (adenosine(37)-N6)-threonylcarbamoyltransferase complex dimerization subunit type 1 TsaB [Schaalia canis]|uniref:tRNA (Adenosine(37)-N6)-threonylcarbamoyltransferase complex dimerization subunit type 1 TsaB n=1 Tax=Schaalia canis TaxID=100469 RepID=A0A3P1SF19_9ACTO|nr:tRNA (adenosine(37)-N6)-threonylcarbamoyltransferase complex dimerization subunit type 1 TsaB [Schaalia canis]RRC95599.1 tRNA (adenosine(37)-N6)-threonylcarbamoyltransferase complex dimerization subunit type 1 TsaB [Schaalia canis]